jgi:hypothetical protein
MRNITHRLSTALLLALTIVPPALAQGARGRGDWSAVQALSPGKKIAVRTKDGDRFTGRFDSATEQAINFTQGGKRVTLARDSVRSVKVSRGRARMKGALVGAAVGGGAGAAGGAASSHGDILRGVTIGGTTVIGAAAGAGVGAAIGLGENYETIYEAP